MGDEIVCTDPKDGKTRWIVKLKGDPSSDPSAAMPT
jgi:hypothetical protein